MSDFPTGWTTASVNNLLAANGLFSDGDWVESKDQDPQGSNRLVQLADIGDGRYLARSNRYLNDEQFQRLGCTELRSGDVLVARMPDPLGRACVFPGLKQRAATVVDVAILRAASELADPRWLMHFVNSPETRAAIAAVTSGSTRLRISRGNLGAIELPVPPLAEQRRIADKLDMLLARIDACRGRLERVGPLLQRYQQSVLDAAVSGRLSESWRMAGARGDAHRALDDLAELLSPGDHKQETDSPYRLDSLGALGSVGGGLTKNGNRIHYPRRRPFLRVANVHANELRLGDVDEIGVTDSEFHRTKLLPGDLLIVEGNGSLEQIGRVAIWSGEIESCTHQNHLIRWRAGKQVDPRFALYCLMSPRGRQQIEKVASSTTGLHTLSLSKVAALQMPVPTLEEQQEIVRRIDRLLSVADRLAERVAGARRAVDRLTPAVLAKAFRGELVPQDPTDEPAQALLDRLRANAPPRAPPRKPGRRATA